MDAIINLTIATLFIVWTIYFVRTFSSSEEREARKRLRDNERRDTIPEEW